MSMPEFEPEETGSSPAAAPPADLETSQETIQTEPSPRTGWRLICLIPHDGK